MSDRLSPTSRPISYELQFKLDFDRFAFTGRQKTIIRISEETQQLRLHCEKLSIRDLSLFTRGEKVPVSQGQENGELHILSERPLDPGEYLLQVSFSGELGDDLAGFYRSRYTDSSGTETYLATTQLEAPYARRVFPCFDEPGFKARFSVTMDIPAHMTALSNMPVESESVSRDRKTVRFATTPSMSTYLLYMGAGEFDYLEEIRGNRTVRVYGVNGKSSQGAYALKFAADTLEFFENYSGIDYPLPKLDLIAIPDFAAGAMENWGAVTFREVLLYIDESSSLPVKKRVAEVIAHELWHQWSGNLVTMEWWDDLWLNEAFATFIAFKAVNHFHPDWHIWDDFIESDTKRAFAMDMLSSTHPIAVPVHTPNEVEEIFDAISYGKGASVLRMVEAYIGEDSFAKGVSAYLSAFAYKNAVADDLWDTLEENSAQSVKKLLVSWVTEPGFPLLTAEGNAKSISLRQERFGTGSSGATSVRPIPLTWVSAGQFEEKLFDTGEAKISRNGHFLKINVNQTGFYRTRYDHELLNSLCDAVHKKVLPVYDRWGLLNDFWACTLAGYSRLEELLHTMDYYRTEKESFVLREISSICSEIAQNLRIAGRGKLLFERYAKPFTTAYNELGIQSSESDSPQKRQIRPLAIQVLIRAENKEVTDKALDLSCRYLDGTPIDPDIRSACLSAVSHTGEEEVFEKVRKAYEEKEGGEEKMALLGTLGEFEKADLLKRYLDYSLTDAVRRQDLRTVFVRAARNSACPDIFFDWAKEHWDTLGDLSKSHLVFIGFLQTLIVTAPDLKTLSGIREFLENNTTGFEKTKAVAFEKAELYIRFREREKDSSFSG